jgi:Holliday junction resolvasome RuvABC DNA-binding subunit
MKYIKLFEKFNSLDEGIGIFIEIDGDMIGVNGPVEFKKEAKKLVQDLKKEAKEAVANKKPEDRGYEMSIYMQDALQSERMIKAFKAIGYEIIQDEEIE